MSEPDSKNPHAVLQRIIDENPGADASAINEKLWRIAENDPDLMRAIVMEVVADFRRRETN